jgi:hypothetical protein
LLYTPCTTIGGKAQKWLPARSFRLKLFIKKGKKIVEKLGDSTGIQLREYTKALKKNFIQSGRRCWCSTGLCAVAAQQHAASSGFLPFHLFVNYYHSAVFI